MSPRIVQKHTHGTWTWIDSLKVIVESELEGAVKMMVNFNVAGGYCSANMKLEINASC